MTINEMNNGRVALQLIEDTLTDGQYVQVNGIYLETNALNEEYSHSYYAKILHVADNKYDLNIGDTVFLNKMYSRTLYRDDEYGDAMITAITNIVGKVTNFTMHKFLNSEEMNIIPIANKCLIEPITNIGEQKYGDIELIDKNSREQKFAKVLAKGSDVDECNLGIETDKYVLMYCDAGTYVRFNNKTLQLINCCFLLCIVDDINTSFMVSYAKEGPHTNKQQKE